MITIAIQCHNFQRRLCWMLSSLAQQMEKNIAVSLAFIKGNGKPKTEQVVELFSPLLRIKVQEYDDLGKFQYRGLVRNRQLKECDTEWILFGDCDMVYHREYFHRLGRILSSSRHSAATYMLSAGRMSIPKANCDLLINPIMCAPKDIYPMIISDAFDRANIELKTPMRNCGAGHSQIVNTIHGRHGGYYVNEAENRDWNWSRRGSNPKSDVQFRKRISAAGGDRVSLPHWFTENAIHLNHSRDPEAGKHLEDQR